jgi:hypothetical protein
LGVFIVILIINQVRNNVTFSDVDQKTVSYNNGPLQLGKGSIAFAQVLDFVLPVKWITLDEKLATLVVVAAAHHGIHGWLIFAGIWVVRIVHWDNEVIHFLLENLLASCILDVSSGGPSSIVRLFFVFITLGSVLNTEIGKSIKLLSPWSVFVSYERLTVKIVVLLLRENSHWVQKKSKVFFEVCWAQNFKLKSWNDTLLDQLLQLSLSYFHAIIVEVILQFLWIKNIEPVLLVSRHGWRGHAWLVLSWRFHPLGVRVRWWSVTWPVLVLGIGPVCLIGIRPLVLILVFKHCLDVLSHGLS